MIIRQSLPKDSNRWDTYVQNHPEGSPYHLWAWKEAVEKAYGHACFYLLAESNNTIIGILPLVHMKLPILQNQLVALPFCDLGGPLADNDEISSCLLDEATKIGKKLGAKNIEVRTRQPKNTINQKRAKNQKVSMLLNLSASSGELWDGFKSKLRSQVRKAEKNGLTFKWGQPEDIQAFYKVFSRNMHELGSPVHSKQWIMAVFTNYGENAKMGLVLFNGQPIGCGMILLCGKTVAIPWASTMREYNLLSPNMLLYWNFLRFSADHGFTLFDFGRSTPEEGTYKFKAQWGAEPTPIVWQSIDPNNQNDPSNAIHSIHQTHQNSRNLAEKIWQKLPLGLANFVGPIIRQYISL